MGAFNVTKLEAAKRQLACAIRMFLAGEDPIAVHTLGHAALRIILDLSRQRGKGEALQSFEDVVRPEKRKQIWTLLARGANFLKHADRDADETLEGVGDAANDWLLLQAITFYADLDASPIAEFQTLSAFMKMAYPEILVDPSMVTGLPHGAEFQHLERTEQLATARQAFAALSRQLGKTWPV